MDADSGCYTVPILVVVDRLFDLISDIKLVNGADGILDSLSPIFSPQRLEGTFRSKLPACRRIFQASAQYFLGSSRAESRGLAKGDMFPHPPALHERKEVCTIEMSCPWIESSGAKKDEEKTLKYGPMMWELKQRYNGYRVEQYNVIIVDVLGGYSKHLEKSVRKLLGARARSVLKRMQKSVISKL
ncbi:unnamed protein product [Porites lobata]|uniref:Uncharacterized protein n=1 Tax=Porites lobata TaxID=104759 RepID=A0ABN8P7H7_9CNID|nr:unnamed protein product [Porites lobata]